MDQDPAPTEHLRSAERSVAAARRDKQSSAARMLLATGLLEMADALEDLEDMPPRPGSSLLDKALDCVAEVADEIGASREPELDDLVLRALMQRSRLLVMLGRPDETNAVTAAIRARVGDDDRQLERAEGLYEQAVGLRTRC